MGNFLLKNLVGYFVCFLVLAIAISSCQGPQIEEPPAEPAEEMKVAAGPNALTADEQAAGWQLLFDGTTLDQWRGFKMEKIPPGWGIEGEALQFSGEHGGEGFGDLMTKAQFANFELSLEWKISPQGNSGVLYRVTEDYEQEFHTGPEVQLIDNAYPDIEPTQSAGANYGFHPPAKDVTKPVGEWNSLRLVVNGAHVEHWMNGEKLVEFELWTDEWKEMVTKTKFSEWADYGMNKTGHIVLQDHGAGVWFRNIKVKQL